GPGAGGGGASAGEAAPARGASRAMSAARTAASRICAAATWMAPAPPPGPARRASGVGGPRAAGPAAREPRARVGVGEGGLRICGLRLVGGLKRGEAPSPASSIGKLVAGPMMQEVAALAIEMQGATGVVSEYGKAEAAARFQTMLLRSAATRIEGGTDEILRNIIAERVLGLPPEPRVDK
ncbi:MAG: hypothetical protein IBJ13_15300, partial [Sphingopyxis sp.]|nr:hypothetical protein [Sphingopyxis sp.]